jgi:hypothetical protein
LHTYPHLYKLPLQVKLKAEIEALQARSAERKLARSAKEQEMAVNRAVFEVGGDVSMESLGEGIPV